DARGSVPDDRDVVVGIEVAPALAVLHPCARASHEMEWSPVAQRLERAPPHSTTPRDEIVVGGSSRAHRRPGGARRGARCLVETYAVELREELPRRLGPAMDVSV